jgi:hypothetical protein
MKYLKPNGNMINKKKVHVTGSVQQMWNPSLIHIKFITMNYTHKLCKEKLC